MYLNHRDLSNYYTLDIEANSLTPDRIYCVVFQNIQSKELFSFHVHNDDYPSFYHAVRQFISDRPSAIWVGHNVTSYDLPNLIHFCDIRFTPDHIIDTLILSYLYHPAIPGGHSLGSWGQRFGYAKGDWTDWSEFSPGMLEYCIRDVELTTKLFLELTKRMRARGFSELSCLIEHKIRKIIDVQQQNGFYFDGAGAQKLSVSLREREARLEEGIRELFPPVQKEQARYTYRVKQDGQPYGSYLRHLEKYPTIEHVDDEYIVYDWQDFSIGSPKQRIEKLLSLGWEPTKFNKPTQGNKQGSPKVDEESLLEFAALAGDNREQIEAIAEWLVVNGRANMIGTWLNNFNDETHCIHGRVFTCGAGTRRMTHNSPNTANIPANGVPYGEEVRGLWQARPGRILVGNDAKACQMRLFGHYLDNNETAQKYLEGDPHQSNADAFGYPDRRAKAKNVFFAFIFGAQPAKIATTLGVPRSEGKRIRQLLFSNNPGLENLIDDVQQEWKSTGGWLECIDGGFVRCPAEHACLNYKIQSAEKCQMALSCILATERAEKAGLDVLKVGDIHDEWQNDCDTRDTAEEFGKLGVQAMRDAGEELGFRVPMDGTYNIGGTWAETH